MEISADTFKHFLLAKKNSEQTDKSGERADH
jgi:hypothetical protein